MLVKFFENNQSTTFIKSIVTATPLPIYDCIQDGDFIISGCTYIYKGKLIKCAVSGILDRRLNDLEPGRSYINRDSSRFIVLDDIDFGSYHDNVTRKETCPNSYYDFDTHRLFGKYLRMIRSYHGIDLMPLYNVYDGSIIDDIYITGNKDYPYMLAKSKSSKILWVPIKFNTGYTIYIDSSKPVKASVMFRASSGPINLKYKPNFEAKSVFDEEYYDTHFSLTAKIKDESEKRQADVSYDNKRRKEFAKSFKPFNLNNVQFRKPFYWPGIKCDIKEIYEYQNYLGLIIQVDRRNVSSVVVLEGDRRDETRIVFNSQNEAWLDKEIDEKHKDIDPRPVSKKRGVKFILDDLTQQEFNNLFRLPKQITLINDKTTYAFNDEIIPYLLHHVITNMETIEGNIARVQEYLPNIHEYEDVWNDRLRIDMFNKIMSDFNTKRFDINGFIDARAEKFLLENKDWLMK